MTLNFGQSIELSMLKVLFLNNETQSDESKHKFSFEKHQIPIHYLTDK